MDDLVQRPEPHRPAKWFQLSSLAHLSDPSISTYTPTVKVRVLKSAIYEMRSGNYVKKTKKFPSLEPYIVGFRLRDSAVLWFVQGYETIKAAVPPIKNQHATPTRSLLKTGSLIGILAPRVPKQGQPRDSPSMAKK